jgi:multidrug resistance efflux pump
MLRIALVGVAAVLLVSVVLLGAYWPFGNGADGQRYFGVVEIQEVRLGSKIGGRVAEVLVMEGDHVKPDDELVRLETPELDAQKQQAVARLQAAEAQLAKAVKGPRDEELEAGVMALAAAKARHTRVTAGWRTEEKEQAASELEAATADLQLALQVFNRVDRLIRSGVKGVATQDEYDAAIASRNRAQGRKDAASAHMKMLHAGSRQEDIDEAAAELGRAEANLKLLRAGTRTEDLAEARAHLAEAQARLREIEANLKEAVIRAPEAATIETIAVRKGDVVAPNQPMLRVLRSSDQWVRIYVPETELALVPKGAQVRVKLDGLPDETFTGRVIHIASISEFTPRNVQSAEERRHQVFGVKVQVENPEGRFKSGMAAEVIFER